MEKVTTSARPIGYFPLPDDFQATESQKDEIVRLFNTRLPVEVDIKWQTNKAPMHGLISVAPPWPTMVKFADVVPLMEACKPGTVLMGLTRSGAPFYRSFTGDTPHWGFSVNTGFGKSTMFCVTGAQILHQESESKLICIDPKAVSFTPLMGIPGVTVHNDFRNVEGMWSGIEAHQNILYERMDILARDPTATFPSQVLMLDELNMFALLTDDAWANKKEREGIKGQQTAPVWKKLMMTLAAGRQFSCYVIIMAQRLDSRSTGNIGLTTILNLKAMAGFGARDWMRFIGTTPVPRSSSTCGRWIYTDGQTRTWVQNTFSDIKDGLEIRDYAMANRSGLAALNTGSPSMPSPVPDCPQPMSLVSSRAPSSGTTEPEGTAGTRWVVGVPAAAAHVGLPIETFKKRRQRTGEIPGKETTGIKPMWRATDLERWAADQSITQSSGRG